MRSDVDSIALTYSLLDRVKDINTLEEATKESNARFSPINLDRYQHEQRLDVRSQGMLTYCKRASACGGILGCTKNYYQEIQCAHRKRVVMSAIALWLQASRLPSQTYIFFPLLLGQAAAYAYSGVFSWRLFAVVQLFGLFIQLYIVYANDYADRDADALNTTYNTFSGGSRVLVTEGGLSASQMVQAIRLMVVLNAAIGVYLTVYHDRPWSLALVVLSLGLLWAYSYPPIKLSYRGGGELLQMVGVAGVLPLFGYYVQAGSLQAFPWALLLLLFPTHLACAISTSLPDYPADKASGKKTSAVRFSPKTARRWVMGLQLLSIVFLHVTAVVSFPWNWLVSIVPLMSLFMMARLGATAEAGSTSLFYFVAFAILGVLAFVVGLAVYLAL